MLRSRKERSVFDFSLQIYMIIFNLHKDR